MLHRATFGRALYDRSFGGGRAVCRIRSRTARGSHLRSFGNCCKRRGHYLRGPPGPGEIRCGHRLRTDGDYGSRFRRRLNFRRTRNDPGTVLGLFAIVILQNGLRLSAQPSELAGILMGVLLVGTILLDRLSKRSRTMSLNRRIQFRGGRSEKLSSRCLKRRHLAGH